VNTPTGRRLQTQPGLLACAAECPGRGVGGALGAHPGGCADLPVCGAGACPVVVKVRVRVTVRLGIGYRVRLESECGAGASPVVVGGPWRVLATVVPRALHFACDTRTYTRMHARRHTHTPIDTCSHNTHSHMHTRMRAGRHSGKPQCIRDLWI